MVNMRMNVLNIGLGELNGTWRCGPVSAEQFTSGRKSIVI